MTQLELLYRKVLWLYPPSGRASARNPVRARADDGLDYMLKDDSGGVPVRAREWLCHRLADCACLPVVEHKPILHPAGRVMFGSRLVLSGGPGSMYNLLAGTLPPAEAETVLSGVYALDLFLGNWDRHADNFVIEPDGAAAPRLRVIDFSEAPALIDPSSRASVPGPATATVVVGRALRKLYGFSFSAAALALDRLQTIPSERMNGIFHDMPADWLATNIRTEFAAWWLSPARDARIATVKNGLSDGTLL